MTNDEGSSNAQMTRTGLASSFLRPSSFDIFALIIDLTPARALSRRPARTCPSLNCRDPAGVRALCGLPFPKLLRPPIRNLPDRRWLLPHPVRDCKNQWRPAHRRESQTRPCSSRNRETDSASAHPVRLFGEYLSVPAIRFDTANDKDAAARTALSARAVDRLNSSGSTYRISLPPATSSPVGQSRCRRDKILPGYAGDRRSSNRPLRTV